MVGRLRTVRQWAISVTLSILLSVCCYAQEKAAFQEKDVEVYGQRIHYLEAGGEGANVILLHGLGGTAKGWAYTIPVVAKKFHVYVPDQIGFGDSDKPQINYRVATMTDFLNGFMKNLGLDRATLVGNSLGGFIALDFTLKHPERVERIVLLDSAGYQDEDLDESAIELLNPATLSGMKALLQLVFYNSRLITDQLVEVSFAAKLERGDSYTIDKFMESFIRGDDVLDGRLTPIKAPTLIVWGREDKLVPLSMGKRFAREIYGSELVVIDQCGHVPQLEKPMEFNKILMDFLGKPMEAK